MGCRNTKAKSSEPTAEGNHATPSPVVASPVSPIGAGAHRRSSISSLGTLSNDVIQRKLTNSSPQIHRIVLTGGPCAGKSTALSLIQTKLPQRTGIKVYCVPEAATLLVGGGLEWTDMNEEKVIEYQLALLRVQVTLEDQFFAIAKASGKPSLIVSDRGTMDGRAYSTPEQFAEILKRGNFELESLRDERYDAVVHMMSAAIGAKEYYNFDNPARYETADEAVTADEKLRQMYVGHPLLRVFDNSTTFEKKLDRVLQFIGQVTGHEFPHHLTRRYVVSKPPTDSEINIPFVRARVTITILHNSTEEEVMQVFKREQDKACVYYYTCIKQNPNQGSAVPPDGGDLNTSNDGLETSHREVSGANALRTEHRISAKEYHSLLLQRDPQRVDVVKENISFMYKSHYFEVATLVSPSWAAGRSVLYVDCDDEGKSEGDQDEIELPPFLAVESKKRECALPTSFHISHISNSVGGK